MYTISFIDGLKESMEEVLGNVEVELDGRFAKIRTGETNLGNDLKYLVTSDIAFKNKLLERY